MVAVALAPRVLPARASVPERRTPKRPHVRLDRRVPPRVPYKALSGIFSGTALSLLSGARPSDGMRTWTLLLPPANQSEPALTRTRASTQRWAETLEWLKKWLRRC